MGKLRNEVVPAHEVWGNLSKEENTEPFSRTHGTLPYQGSGLLPAPLEVAKDLFLILPLPSALPAFRQFARLNVGSISRWWPEYAALRVSSVTKIPRSATRKFPTLSAGGEHHPLGLA